MDKIKKIEGRTKDEVINILKVNGLGKNRRQKWRDYSAAKRLCFEGSFIDSFIFNKQIKWICEYLKV